MRIFRLALAQMNATVGDLKANAAKIAGLIQQAESLGADLVAFPELALTGYPPEDLLLEPEFVQANLDALREVAAAAGDTVALIGFVDRGSDLHNAAALCRRGQVAGVYHKMFLPNYGVFDEVRYFQAGRDPVVWRIGDARVGVTICEDMWYPEGPAADEANAGAELLLNLSSSPFHAGKAQRRERMFSTRASDLLAWVAHVNMVGGQDELVFDGRSIAFDPEGELVLRAPAFEESLAVADLDLDAVLRHRLSDPRRRATLREARPTEERVLADERPPRERPAIEPLVAAPADGPAEIYAALVTGTRDYIRKNGFGDVLVGLSGGIDSSMVAAIAAEAIGPEHVHGVGMPSPYSSPGSLADARTLAQNLGMEFIEAPITPILESFRSGLVPALGGPPQGVADENLQARIRGNILMALSNTRGWLLLTTGNKSEMAVGYATLYGDMAGGFAVLKDVVKGEVYACARYRNQRDGRQTIPQSVLDKPPSAELRPNQKDTDSLPPYDVLDRVLYAYVEENMGRAEIEALGIDPETVRRVIRMVDAAEYKRRQAPPGVKITPRAFGRDRRMPITNRFRRGA